MSDIELISPQLVLLASAGALIIIDALLPLFGRSAWQSRHVTSVVISLAGIAGSIAACVGVALEDDPSVAFDGMLAIDDFAVFFNFLFAGIAGMIVLGSVDFLARHRFHAEYLALVLASTAAMMFMAAGADLVMIFIALETQAIALYVLVAMLKDGVSSEASLKYLLLGAVSTALTLYGMAYLFGLSGETSLDGVAAYVRDADSGTRSALVLAAVLLAGGLGFKMAVVPFQMWVPDVYQGAPTPVTAYLSVASKAAGFAVVLRIFLVAMGEGLITSDWATLFAIISAFSMFAGNLMALRQSNIKRMLGYSSIAQAGTFLIGLAAVAASDPQPELGASAVVFFLGAYAFTNLGAFIAIIAIAHKLGSTEISDYAGLHKRSPLLAFGLAACLISLTGIPPTVGFWGKLYVFNAAVQADLIWLALIGVINSVIAAYYYLRVVLFMYSQEPQIEDRFQPSFYLAAGLAVAVLGLLLFGVYPSPLIEASESAAAVFTA
jgi:NADH-quinone oxidoreductase subunit N